ncbi:energy-coupled thiamine transporter ThiT [Lacticaseibacillus baoqingensis]|uniref:Energy-coupled thiamine transporter ThiT n=1 Tax=Lacticaseibacillus baoqingensis TaxID=2486013 RepID=A0ABW4E402_9LACO|nr:energy-coupled thiamine transporter ThiT [Lacticaseibacillus baoqingensis]
MQQSHQKLQVLLEVAIIAAFAMALEYVPHKTGISSVEMSYGVIPISVLALRRGAGPAMAAGFTWGILDLLLIGIGEGSVLNVTQGFIEYPVAFTVAGLGGVFFKPFQKALQKDQRLTSWAYAWGAVLLGVLAKYLCHFYAGWIFWGAYAPKGMPAWLYSLVINGLSAVFTGVLALVVVTALVSIAKHLFLAKTTARLAHD